MHNDSFFNPMDWYNANKHRLTPFYKLFEHPFLAYVFKWKEIEYKMIPVLREYIKKYYPEVYNDPALDIDVQKACEHATINLTEIIYKCINYSAAGACLQQTYPAMYPLLKPAIASFKREGAMLTPDNYPEWVYMISDEEERAAEIAEHNHNTQKSIDQNREFIDITQPVIIEALPAVMEIEGEWWINYQYAYAQAFNTIKDWMDYVSHNGSWAKKLFTKLNGLDQPA